MSAAEEQPGHLRERWRSPSIDTRMQPGTPREPNEIPVIGIVVRMVVRQENVAECGQRHSGERELARDTVATVDDVDGIIRDDDLCGRRASLAWPGTTARTKKDQPGLHALPCLGAAQRLASCCLDPRKVQCKDPCRAAAAAITAPFCAGASGRPGETGYAGNVSNTSAGRCRPSGSAWAARRLSVVFPAPGAPVTIVIPLIESRPLPNAAYQPRRALRAVGWMRLLSVRLIGDMT